MSIEVPQDYRYHNPNETDPAFNTFEVVSSVQVSQGDYQELAKAYQTVKLDAFRDAYRGYLTPESIATTVNPDDARLVSEEAERLENAAQDGVSNYVHARIVEPDQLLNGLGYYVTGVAHVEYVKTDRHLLSRLSRRLEPAEVADISDIFVGPTYRDTDIDLQRKGYGVALAFSLLDRIPEDSTPLIVNAFPINREVQPLLEKFGFHAEDLGSVAVKLFNTQAFNCNQYRGPNRGELWQQLVDTAPWLAQREPIEG